MAGGVPPLGPLSPTPAPTFAPTLALALTRTRKNPNPEPEPQPRARTPTPTPTPTPTLALTLTLTLALALTLASYDDFFGAADEAADGCATSPYLPISPYISLHLPISPYISRRPTRRHLQPSLGLELGVKAGVIANPKPIAADVACVFGGGGHTNSR